MHSDFALVLRAAGVQHSCPPYLETRTHYVRGVGVFSVRLPGRVFQLSNSACLVTLYGLVCDAVGCFFTRRPYRGRRKNRPSGLRPSLCVSGPSALRLGFFGNWMPCAAPRPLPPPSEGHVRSGPVEGVLSVSSREVSPHPPAVRWGRRGGGGCREGLGLCRRERFGCFFPPRGRGSGIITLTAFPCASLTLPRWSLPAIQLSPRVGRLEESTGARQGLPAVQLSRELDSWESLPGPAPAHALPVYLPRGVEILVKSVAVPALSLGGRVPCLESRALAPQAVCGCVDENALAMTRHTSLLPVCVIVDPGRDLLTATRTNEYAHAPGATVRCRDDCARDRLAFARPGVNARGHTGPAIGHRTITVS